MAPSGLLPVQGVHPRRTATRHLSRARGEDGVDWQRCVGLFLEGFSLLCETPRGSGTRGSSGAVGGCTTTRTG